MKRLYLTFLIFSFLLCRSIPSCAQDDAYDQPESVESIQQQIAPYIIPSEHKMKKALKEIFKKFPEAMANSKTLRAAGFSILYHQPKSKIVVAQHPQLQGYLLKGYLDTEKPLVHQLPHWKLLLNRCIGAENIRKLIKKEKLSLFKVPDKWLYVVPREKFTLVLLVTDMRLVSIGQSQRAWKYKASKKHLRELYSILSHGYASCWLAENIPYSKDGFFTCIDTEYPERQLDCRKARRYFSESMQAYWDTLLR